MRWSKTRVFILAALCLVCLGSLWVLGCDDDGDAEAQDMAMFTDASLNGTYSFYIIGLGGGAPLAGLSVLTFDGNGFTTSNTATLNIPGATFGERLNFSFAGVPTSTYVVNPDGTGSNMSDFDADGDGMTDFSLQYDFVITAFEEVDGVNLATELSFVVQTLGGPTGTLNTFVMKRLPDGAVFDDTLLQGEYALVSAGRGGQGQAQSPEAGLGVATFNGNGTFGNGRFLNNQPGPNTPGLGERQRVTIDPFEGTYDLATEANGRGTASIPGIGDGLMVITEIEEVDGVSVATEFFVVANDLSPNTGNLITLIGTRR
jgi:hypothetical protein